MLFFRVTINSDTTVSHKCCLSVRHCFGGKIFIALNVMRFLHGRIGCVIIYLAISLYTSIHTNGIKHWQSIKINL